MKTKEEVIKALELCRDQDAPCTECPYKDNDHCVRTLAGDAAELLKAVQDGASKELDTSGT